MSDPGDNEVVLIDHEHTVDYNADNILPQSPEEIEKIRIWLKPTDYNLVSGEYRKHEQCHVPGTGSWLTATDTYQAWLKGSEHGLLWIKGIPGSGKSVIAAKLVNELSKSHPGVPVLYFFFRQIIDANHEPTALLRDWLDQVLVYSPPLQRRLKEYRKNRRTIDSMSIDDLWKDLQLAFSLLPDKVFCIADALDEMDQGNETFVRALGILGQWQPAKVKVLMTSRPVPGIEAPLRSVRTLQIRLQESLVDVDISFFVQQALQRTSMNTSDQELILGAIPGRANGLFLYAKLALDAFLEPGARVHEVSQSLPLNLSQMYTNLLHEHARRSGVPHEIQLLILQWITHATRPLRLLEIAEMINTTHYSNSKSDLKSIKNLVRAAMGPLIEILPDETICVVHHSFTEYLKGSSRIVSENEYQILRPGHTHMTLALACLAYLQAGCLNQVRLDDLKDTKPGNDSGHEDRRTLPSVDKERRQFRLKYPFLEYASANWHVHVVKAATSGRNQPRLTQAIDGFLGDHKIRTAWLKLEWRKPGEGLYQRVTRLHVAARHGLLDYAQTLLSSPDVEVNARDSYGRTPLWWAAAHGHAEIIQSLVAAGANPDQEEHISGLKPLHRAASKNHYLAVKALLEAGVDPLTKKTKEHPGRWCGNAPRSTGHTALMYACQNSHLETVDVFLSLIDNVETVQRALIWTAGRSHPKVLDRVLKYPSLNINAKVRGDTALYVACGSIGNKEKILALIKAGADPKVLCEGSVDEFASSLYQNRRLKEDPTRGTTALHTFCGNGTTRRGERGVTADAETWTTLFSALMSAGADIHQKDHHGATPLHCCANNPVLMRLLLEAGAEVNAIADDGATPLHKAKLPEAIEILLKQGGAEINQSTFDGQVPLLRRISDRDKEAVSKLLEYRANVHVEDNVGNGVLHAAIASCSTDTAIFEELIAAGADPNHKNRAGQTPMHGLRLNDRGAITMLDILLAAGANINERDGSGATMLFRSFSRNHSDIKELMDRGAMTDLLDFQGRSLLHDAIKKYPTRSRMMDAFSADTSRFDFLLNLTPNVKVIDYRGNTLFHELALRCLRDAYIGLTPWKQLQSLAVDIDQRNHQGRSALHVLSSKKQNSWFVEPRTIGPIDFVLSCTKHIDAPDRKGITPLHLASTTSEFNTKKLLDAGANPNLATFEGLTPLHLAARSQQSNIVGLLLKALSSSKTQRALNARDSTGWTALCYACRSGRPETVTLLLDAGCDLANSAEIFTALTQFEDEQTLWKLPRSPSDDAENGDAGALTLQDQSRPNISKDLWIKVPELLPVHETARLEEIVDMLVARGCILNGPSLKIPSHGLSDYTTRCLLRARHDLDLTQSLLGTDSQVASFVAHAVQYRQKATIHALEDFDRIKQGQSNTQLIAHLLRHREFEAIERLPSLGVDLLQQDDKENCSSFEYLVRGGFSAIVNKLCLLEAETEKALNGQTSTRAYSALRYALHSTLPNMEVVRALVERLHVNLDEIVSDQSPLHQIARGLVWWHTHLALPYLISKGANINIKDKIGRTPLHVALGGPGGVDGMYHKEVVQILVEAGADVNAVDVDGKSCLSFVGKDVQMIRLLIEHGARIEIDAVFAAIDARQADVLEILLSAGSFANTKYFMSSNNLPPAEWFPVQYAATKHSAWALISKSQRDSNNQASIQMVKLLLEHGADPFATYWEPIEDDKTENDFSDDDEETGRPLDCKHSPKASQLECSVLHELIIDGDLVQPFLDLPDLDPNRCDSRGRTLLHAAAHSSFGPDAPVDKVLIGRDGASVQPSLFDIVLAKGADVLARDNDGKNVLHYMFEKHNSRYHNKPKVVRTLRMLAAKHQSLLEMHDKEGKIPLHAAAIYTVAQGITEPTEALLDAGSDIGVPDQDGNTALHILAYRLIDSPAVRRMLSPILEKGLDVNVKNKKGETPIFSLYMEPPKQFGRPHSTRDMDVDENAFLLLENAGADLFARNRKGQGLLHYAAKGKVRRFQVLMEKGLDPMLEDDSRRTALDIAAACGNEDVLSLFERREGGAR